MDLQEAAPHSTQQPEAFAWSVISGPCNWWAQSFTSPTTSAPPPSSNPPPVSHRTYARRRRTSYLRPVRKPATSTPTTVAGTTFSSSRGAALSGQGSQNRLRLSPRSSNTHAPTIRGNIFSHSFNRPEYRSQPLHTSVTGRCRCAECGCQPIHQQPHWQLRPLQDRRRPGLRAIKHPQDQEGRPCGVRE